MTPEEMDKRFEYHAPDGTKAHVHTDMRDIIHSVAIEVNDTFPDNSRELSLFFTHLEEAGFWLQAHIARNL